MVGDFIQFLTILLICISTDIGGYVFGKLFKGPKLTKISPNKTYSGVLGGFILSVIAGSIYSQKIYSVDYSSQADIKVYVVDYESLCDLKVYKVEYSVQADGNDGLWHFVDYASQADKKIHFVDYESQSDLKIYFVKYKSQAGWKNNSKKHLFY